MAEGACMPGAIVVLALSVIYASFGNVPVVAALFFGIKAAVLVIVIEALIIGAFRPFWQSHRVWHSRCTSSDSSQQKEK
jgi:chromate transport protein ChrA